MQVNMLSMPLVLFYNMYNRQKLYFMLSYQVILYFTFIYGVTMFYDSCLVKTCENITFRRKI